MDIQSVLQLAGATVGGLFYLFCVLQAISAKNRLWMIAPYAVAMVPVIVHAFNYNLGFETLLAAIIMVALTKLIVVLAAKE